MEYYSYEYGYELPDTMSPFLAGIGVGTYMIYLAIAVLSIVALWMIFKKAGEEGWASIIPFYNTYVLYKITWGNGWYFLLLLIPIANIVIGIITLVKLARVFGKGGGFACGLIFLSTIFLCILAFSKDIVYVGVPGQQSNGGAAAGGFQNPYSQPSQNNYQNTTTQQSAQNSQYYYQQTDASQGPKYCPTCGAALEPGAKFCPTCGKSL